MRDFILVLAILSIIGAGWFTISQNQKGQQSEQVLNRERYQRMVAQEDLHNTRIKLKSLETEAGSLRSHLSEAQQKIASIQAQLEDEIAKRAGLESQLEVAAGQLELMQE